MENPLKKVKNEQSLFEILTTKIFAQKHFSHSFLGNISNNNVFEWMSYEDVYNQCIHFGLGLITCGLIKGGGEFVGICSTNRSEWVVADFASCLFNFVLVPLLSSNDEESLTHIIKEAELSVVICSNDVYEKIGRISDGDIMLVLMDGDEGKADSKSMKEISEMGRKEYKEGYEFPGRLRRETDPFTIIYTSGSTGSPKGALFEDHNWSAFLNKSLKEELDPARVISFSPLAHISERRILWLESLFGGQYGFFSGNMSNIFDDIQKLNPTYISCSPRLYNVLYSNFEDEVLKELRKGEKQRYKIEKEVLSSFKHLLGNRLEMLVTGSAPTSEKVKSFLKRCFNVPVYDGYGTTELGSIAVDGILNTKDVEVKLVDVPELGYYTTDNPPRGEIVVKGNGMITKYFKNAEKTKQSFTEDGYFKTGDVGVQTLPHLLKIIDRKTNVVKLSQGEFIVPSKIESRIEKSHFVDQVCVFGVPKMDKVVAIISPNMKAFEDLHLTQDEMKLLMMKDIQRICCKDLQMFEIPSSIIVSSAPFTFENGLLTPTLKMRRNEIKKRFESEMNHSETAKSSQELNEKLESLILEEMGERASDSIKLDESFVYHGGDSLSAVKISLKMKETFDVDVPVSFILSNPTVEELSEFIQEQKEEGERELPQSMFEDLENVLRYVGSATKEKSKREKVIKKVFLTGSTGFLGRFVLRELLQQKNDIQVVCLVRDVNRVKQSDDRIEWIVGDLRKETLGLSQIQFETLCQTADLVIHCAANVNWMLSYSDLRSSNVCCMKDLIKLCTTGKAKHLCYVSTISASPFNTKYETLEERANFEWCKTFSPYVQSKFMGEELLFACAEQLSFSVFRPANISFDLQSGTANVTDYINRYVKTCVSIGACLNEASIFNFTPVAFVANAIVKNVFGIDSIDGKIISISNNKSPSYAMVAEALLEEYHLELLTYNDYRKKLLAFENKEQLALYGLIPLFTEDVWIYNEAESDKCTFDFDKEITKEDFKMWFAYLKEINFV